MKINLFLILLFIQYSCVTKQEKELIFTPIKKEIVSNISSQVINSSLMMIMARDIDIYGDYLIVRTFTDNKYLHILNKNTGEVITNLAIKGNGPNEITDMADQIHIDKGGNLYWFDYNKKKLFGTSIDSIANSSFSIKTTNFESHFTNIDLALPLHRGYLLSLGDKHSDQNETQRYAVADSLNIKSIYSGFPVIKNETRRPEDVYLNYRTSQHITLSPDLSRFVTSEIYGGILEIFHLSDSIKRNSIHPLYEAKPNELHGFVDVYATDYFIYAIKIDSNMNGSNPENRYNKIMVFNWNGEYIRTYQTDYNLLTLCVDEESRHIYAIGQDISLNSELQVLSLKI